ncbi:MAG: hypothetical protein IPK93_01110 [Solirubrobacterales bacterium]|nr:hypothetical protein [Solirubrobacterales bacterium]
MRCDRRLGHLALPTLLQTLGAAIVLAIVVVGTGAEICTVAADYQGGQYGILGGEFIAANDVAADQAGNVYSLESANNRVQKFDSSGNFLRTWGKGVDSVSAGDGYEVCTVAADCKTGVPGSSGGEFRGGLQGVAASTSGLVYVVDNGSDRIQVFDTAGGFLGTSGKDVDSVAPGTGFEICTVAANCKFGVAGGLAGEFDDPRDVATDPAGDVYITDLGNQRVQKSGFAGTFQGIWGKDVDIGGGTGAEICTSAADCQSGSPGGLGGELSYPAGAATDADGNLFVADTGNKRIQKFTDTTPPQTTIDSGPNGPTTDITPTFGFSAEAGVILRCSIATGTPTFGPCSAASSHTDAAPLADGDYQFFVEATDSATNSASASRNFTVDTIPPDTTINSGPSGTITTNEATFTFGGDPAVDIAGLQCKIDSGSFADCLSPKTFTGLAEGSHTAAFRAEDTAGNQDQSPATRTFTVDTTAPVTTIDSGPTGTITTNEAAFTFSSSEAGSSFECGIDGGDLSPCSSPKSYSGLSDGPHRFAVRAIDEAGNTDLSEVARVFTVDTTPPDTTIYKAKIRKVKVKGAAKAKKGKKAAYKVKVKNSGNAVARGVKLKVTGKGVKAKKSVGKIRAGKWKTVKVKLRFKKPGKIKTTFKVTSKNAGGKSAKKKIKVKK